MPPTKEDTNNAETKSFFGTFKLRENHKNEMFGCAFNQFIKWPATQIAAVVGGNHVHIYEFPEKEQTINKLFDLPFSSTYDEIFYSVSWCRDKGRMKVVAGGDSGLLYVWDYAEKTLERALTGCNNHINDIRTSPVNSTLIAVCSDDHTARIFDVRSSTCLFILGGRTSHQQKVLSVDWAPDMSYLVSVSMDHLILAWDLSTTEAKEHLRLCQFDLENGNEIREFDYYKENPLLEKSRELVNADKKALFITQPSHRINNLHFQCIDCIRIIPAGPNLSQAYNFTKSVTNHPNIQCWRFGSHNQRTETPSPGEPCVSHVRMFKKNVENGKICFNKFAVDPQRKWLVSGRDQGDLQFFDIRDFEGTEVSHIIDTGSHQIRQVDFCDGGHIIIVIAVNGFVCRLDRVKPGEQKADTWKKRI